METVYATRNTEYHLRGDLCVAVRDRRTGEWLSSHESLGHKVTCMVAAVRGEWRKHALSPRVGSCLWFDGVQVTTGSIRVIRPATPHEVAQYPLLAGATIVDVRHLPAAREDQTGRQSTEMDRWEPVDPSWLETHH